MSVHSEEGSAASPPQSDVPPPRIWEQRGTLLSICIDVGSLSGKTFLVLFTLLIKLLLDFPSVQPIRCEKDFSNILLQCFCQYTEAYCKVFPSIVLGILMVFIAQGILQRRLYYSLLKQGCVIDYRQATEGLADPIIRVMMWTYFHVLLYLVCALLVVPSPTVSVQAVSQWSTSSVTFKAHHLTPSVNLDSLSAVAPFMVSYNATTVFSEAHAVGVPRWHAPLGFLAQDSLLGRHTVRSIPTIKHTKEPGKGYSPGSPNYAEQELMKQGSVKKHKSIWEKLLAFVIIPGGIVVVFMYLDYNITKYLVPLSEFAFDGKEDGSLANLIVLSHTRLRTAHLALTSSDQDGGSTGLVASSNAVATYRELIAEASKNQSSEQEPPTFMLSSLWPGNLLLSPHIATDIFIARFRRMWWAVFIFAEIILLIAFGNVVMLIGTSVKGILYEGHRSLVCAVVVYIGTAILVLMFSWRIWDNSRGLCQKAR